MNSIFAGHCQTVGVCFHVLLSETEFQDEGEGGDEAIAKLKQVPSLPAPPLHSDQMSIGKKQTNQARRNGLHRNLR